MCMEKKIKFDTFVMLSRIKYARAVNLQRKFQWQRRRKILTKRSEWVQLGLTFFKKKIWFASLSFRTFSLCACDKRKVKFRFTSSYVNGLFSCCFIPFLCASLASVRTAPHQYQLLFNLFSINSSFTHKVFASEEMKSKEVSNLVYYYLYHARQHLTLYS